MLNPLPSILHACEFSRLHFYLEFQESVPAGEDVLLRLRRDLRQAGREVLGHGERFDLLFDPPLSADPVARRHFQRPGPPFVILPPDKIPRQLEPGDILPLSVVFWGKGRQGIADFIRVLQSFGATGLHRREGRFELLSVEGGDAAGNIRPLWQPGEDPVRFSAPVQDARWWLETSLPAGLPLRLEFVTPARLIADGRPLFHASFSRLFPFILRRVTSMLHAHCGLEVVDNPRHLIACAAQVDELENTLVWRDWRVLERDEGKQELGGLVGALLLEGDAVHELMWILGLGSLTNLGKGAAFASGHYHLKSDEMFESL
jgi:hypothetical protein